MTEHACVRNPETGCCYVCRTPMRLNRPASSMLEAIVDATQHPAPAAPPAANHCACGARIKAPETQCVDCWIAGQTKQTPAKPVKQAKPTPNTAVIDLDSILAAMTEKNPDKWN